jgi:hypothetical protein
MDLSGSITTADDASIPVVLVSDNKGGYVLYHLSGDTAEKLGTCVNTFVDKGDSFVYYSKYDALSKEISAHYYCDGKTVDLGDSVGFVMSY